MQEGQPFIGIETVCGCRSCKNPVKLNYSERLLYFCVEKCKEEFLEAKDKEKWLMNHR